MHFNNKIIKTLKNINKIVIIGIKLHILIESSNINLERFNLVYYFKNIQSIQKSFSIIEKDLINENVVII
jgi:hypothetical protein